MPGDVGLYFLMAMNQSLTLFGSVSVHAERLALSSTRLDHGNRMDLNPFKIVYSIAFFKRYDRFLPMFAPANRLAKALTLSEAILSPDRQDRHLEKLLNGLLNLGLVGRKCDLENELIVLIFKGRTLFSNNGPSDYLVLFQHQPNLSCILGTAASRTTRRSKRSRS